MKLKYNNCQIFSDQSKKNRVTSVTGHFPNFFKSILISVRLGKTKQLKLYTFQYTLIFFSFDRILV